LVPIIAGCEVGDRRHVKSSKREVLGIQQRGEGKRMIAKKGLKQRAKFFSCIIHKAFFDIPQF
jgi:hypothetical protein